MKLRILIAFFLLTLVVSLSCYPETKTAQGYQDIGAPAKGTQKGATPMIVGPTGIVITKVQTSCATRGWIEKESNGRRIEYLKFYTKDQLINYTINDPGKYYVYPVPDDHCTMASVHVTYKDK